MTSILDNERVWKYFGSGNQDSRGVAYEILRAMQEPIRKGERYLLHRQIPDMYGEAVYEGEEILSVKGFHPFALRLPDKFQTAGCNCGCHDPGNTNDGQYGQVCCPKPADPGKCYCQKYNVKGEFNYHSPWDCSSQPMPLHDPEKVAEDQFLKAAEEVGKFVRAKFEELARATK